MRHIPVHEIELYREDQAYVVYVDCPVDDREELEVSLESNRLEVSVPGDRPGGGPGRESTDGFTRHVDLPRAVEGEELVTAFYDGILEVRIPLAETGDESGGSDEVGR